MKIYLLMKDGSRRRKCRLPYEDAAFALAEGSCPYCGVEEQGPALRGFKIAGSNRRASADDRAWEADAGCLACKTHLGTLRVETNTLFGVTEDERVLRGRVGVY